jgi:hypothetical protein
MKKEITNTGIFECEDRNFVFVECEGILYVAETLIVAPRNSEDADTQAFDELQDSGILDD